MASGLKPDFPVPAHVGIVMDGNGRWAQRDGKARVRGHEAGVESTRIVTEAAAEWGIRHLTLYAFSTENWERPRDEIDFLMELLGRQLVIEKDTMLRNDIRLLGIGRLDDLPATVLEPLRAVEAATAHCRRMTLRLALSYGGRQEILDAAQRLAAEVLQGRLQPQDIDLKAFAARLDHPELPDMDLMIRTGGEQRLSNFLLWRAAYTEFWFTDVLWPDFRREHLLQALRDFHGRSRRFGRVLEPGSAGPPGA